MAKSARHRQLARIHLLSKELQLERDQYEAVLFTVAGVESSKSLDEPGRIKVIRHLEERLPKGKRYRRRPHNADSPDRKQLKKIEALLTDASLPWEYAMGMARHMYSKDRLEFCSSNELTGIIAALQKQAVKRLSKALEEKAQELLLPLIHLPYMARVLVDFDCSTRNLWTDPQAMSLLLRWLNGKLSPSCDYQHPEGANACAGCRYRFSQRQR